MIDEKRIIYAKAQAKILIDKGVAETDTSKAWTDFDCAKRWIERIQTTYDGDFTVEDYETIEYCQQMMNNL